MIHLCVIITMASKKKIISYDKNIVKKLNFGSEKINHGDYESSESHSSLTFDEMKYIFLY
jgi:hypothetical protein